MITAQKLYGLFSCDCLTYLKGISTCFENKVLLKQEISILVEIIVLIVKVKVIKTNSLLKVKNDD